MKKLILTTVLALSAIGAFAQFSNQTIDVNGVTRNYRQYIPSGLNPATEHVPLVIAMHGMGDDMQNFSGVGFSYFADTARFICIFPQGEMNTFMQASSWNNGTAIASTADDIAFMNALIDHFYNTQGIDLARVYACGFSMGAIMSNRLGCQLSNRIAAIAPVCGALSSADLNSCNPGRPVPVMMMNSTADDLVPYGQATTPTLSSAQLSLDFWNQNNGNTDSTVTPVPHTTSDSVTVDKIFYTGGTAPVNMWRQNNGGHQWLFAPNNDVDATTEIWLFFRDKVHPNPAMVSVEENAAPAVSIYVANGELTINAEKNITQIEVYDIQGKLLHTSNPSTIASAKINLDTQPSQMLVVKAVVGGQTVVKRVVVY